MKLVDKLILFSRFLRDNKDHELDLDTLLTTQKEYFKEQSRYWRDKTDYTEIDSVVSEMQTLTARYNDLLRNINQKTNELLRKEELLILRNDYETFESSEHNLDLVRERAYRDTEIIERIAADVGFYSDWHYAGVELNPSNGVLTQSMLACDPLYIYTGNIADTDSIRNKFNNFFSTRRLMFYNNLKNLPQNQFGLATSINCYEFWPMDPIKDEISRVYNLLRPGGYFIFTYNNCEQLPSLDLCAGPKGYRSYNTKELMTNMVRMFGFQIVSEQSHRDTHSWMIVKKPGDLTSQKLCSPLVEIKTSK